MRTVPCVLAVVVLVAASGCAGLGGGGTEPVAIGSETSSDGTSFLYFEPVDGTTLSPDATVTINTTIPGGENRSTDLGERVESGTKVYPGGPITGAAATEFHVGGPPPVAQIPRPLYYEVVVQITVETGNATVNETFTFGG